MPHLDGGCACGQVRYRLISLPIVTNACHCRFCQKLSGSAFAVNAIIESDRLAVLADMPEAVDTPSALPMGQIVHRCPTCRVALWFTHGMMGPRFALVRTGTLDEPDAVPVDVHCFTATKRAWVVVPEGVPAFAGRPDPQAGFTPATRARFLEAMG